MVKEIYFHVGLPKTGTTSIQHFLYINRKVLKRDYDVDYLTPEVKFDLHTSDYNHLFQFSQTSFSHYDHSSDLIIVDKLMQQLLKKIQKSSCSRVLVSSESFIDLPNLEFFTNEIFGKYDIKIIIYLRNAADFLASLWSHSHNQIYYRTTRMPMLEEYLITTDDYKKELQILLKLSDIFGKDSIIIKSFEKEKFKQVPLIPDFLSILNIEATEVFIYEKALNTGVSRKMNDLSYLLCPLALNLIDKVSLAEMEYFLTQIKGGDERKAIETVSDEIIMKACDLHKDIEQEVVEKLNGGKPLFINKYPDCCGKSRASHIEFDNDDKYLISLWVMSLMEKKEGLKNRLYNSLANGYYLSKIRKFIINCIPNKRLRHKYREIFKG